MCFWVNVFALFCRQELSPSFSLLLASLCFLCTELSCIIWCWGLGRNLEVLKIDHIYIDVNDAKSSYKSVWKNIPEYGEQLYP